MLPLLLTLLVGIGLELLVFMGLRRLLKLSAYQSGIILAALVIFGYLPLALVLRPGADVFVLSLSLLLLTPFALGVLANSARRAPGRRLHWAPLALMFFFLGLAAVNAVLIVVAEQGLPGPLAQWLMPSAADSERGISSKFPGTVEHDYQEQEARFNAYLAERQAQADRGWQVRIGWRDTPYAGQRNTLKIKVRDRADQPISDARVRGKLLRPADQSLDQTFTMAPRGSGIYLAELAPAVPGRWDVLLTIRRGEAEHELQASTTVQAAQ